MSPGLSAARIGLPTASATGGPGPAPFLPMSLEAAELTPADAVLYFSGKYPGLEGATPDSINNFSPSDILETMDTVVLDTVRRTSGEAALARVHETIARAALDALLDLYGAQPVLVPLDAGHGGKRGYYWDPGAEGTEVEHNRAVVAAMERLVAAEPQYATIQLNRIFNDAIADDFRVPGDLNNQTYNQILMRQARASMLAAWAMQFNRDHPGQEIAVHELSIHFNAGANGLMVLHQGNVDRDFMERSRDYARHYIGRALDSLNATDLLPSTLRRWGGSGMHDDVMMYSPPYISAAEAAAHTPRYGVLQGSWHLRRYVDTILENWR